MTSPTRPFNESSRVRVEGYTFYNATRGVQSAGRSRSGAQRQKIIYRKDQCNNEVSGKYFLESGTAVITNLLFSKLLDRISQFPYLKELHVSVDSDFTLSEKELKCLSSLEVLNLKNCRMKEFPKGIEHLGDLKEIDLAGNCLKSLPEKFFFTLAESISLEENGDLEVLPDIPENPHVQTLNLISTGLKEVPKSIKNLTNLVNLRLLGTGITSLPKTINELSKLVLLGIQGTDVEEVPDLRGTQVESFIGFYYTEQLPEEKRGKKLTREEEFKYVEKDFLLPEGLKVDKTKLPSTFNLFELDRRS